MKEVEEIINISFLELTEDDESAVYDLVYGLKKLFEARIAEHEGLESEQEGGDVAEDARAEPTEKSE